MCIRDRFETEAYNFNKIGDFMMWRAAVDAPSISYGNFLYMSKPTKAVDGVAFVGAEVLREFGAKVQADANSAAFAAANGSMTITAGSSSAVKAGAAVTLKHTPFSENGTVYVALDDVADVVGYTFSYRPHSDLVFAKKTATE